MPTNDIQLDLTIAEPGADIEQVDLLTRRLMRDLHNLGVEFVERPTDGSIPEGAKAGTASTWGALLVGVAPPFLTKLIEFLQSWVLRSECTVVVKVPTGVEVEFTSKKRLSQEELVALVEELARAQVE
jgi:hypothetical protein